MNSNVDRSQFLSNYFFSMIEDPQQLGISQVVKHFTISGNLISASPITTGHINRSWISTWQEADGTARYIHQRINRTVFKDVALVMSNIEAVINHIRTRCKDKERETLTIVGTTQGKSYLVDEQGEFWRTYKYIENSSNFLICTQSWQAYQAGIVLAKFHKYLADFDHCRVFETISGFQDVPGRLTGLQTSS